MGICEYTSIPQDIAYAVSQRHLICRYFIWETMCGLVESFKNGSIALLFREHINNTKDIFFIICSCSHSHWSLDETTP